MSGSQGDRDKSHKHTLHPSQGLGEVARRSSCLSLAVVFLVRESLALVLDTTKRARADAGSLSDWGCFSSSTDCHLCHFSLGPSLP